MFRPPIVWPSSGRCSRLRYL